MDSRDKSKSYFSLWAFIDPIVLANVQIVPRSSNALESRTESRTGKILDKMEATPLKTGGTSYMYLPTADDADAKTSILVISMELMWVSEIIN